MKERVVEKNQKQHYSSENEEHEVGETHEEKDAQELAPGILIIRSNTPRPFTLKTPSVAQSSAGGQPQREKQSDTSRIPAFPSNAPSAPPVPEELSDEDTSIDPLATPAHTTKTKTSAEVRPEFIWLFEYGLEMDAAILNSPERLHGLALLYGPALLRGFSIMIGNTRGYGGHEGAGRTIATIAPDANAEVWGLLYRVPRRLIEASGAEPSPLDAVHTATPAQNLFRPIQVFVHDIYRDRKIECITYIATDALRQRLQPLSYHILSDTLFVQRLVAIVRKQRLPEKYLGPYLDLITPEHRTDRRAEPNNERAATTSTAVRVEQNTEPLPIVAEKPETPLPVNTQLKARDKGTERIGEQVKVEPASNHWLLAFAIYLVVLLLASLTFAALQGMGFTNAVVTSNLTFLEVPWLVVMYGLLGGCVSCIITLDRSYARRRPAFIIITWFARPYVGAVLASVAYHLLTSGTFALEGSVQEHMALFLMVGTIAGFCEGWIFVRRR
jgi:hypothetical protein